jgi:hypothetical protein
VPDMLPVDNTKVQPLAFFDSVTVHVKPPFDLNAPTSKFNGL